MAAPAPQQVATGYGESVLTPNAPPAYSEKQPLGAEGQAPAQQQAGQLLQGQYPQQVQITGGVLPQTWPQGYPVSSRWQFMPGPRHHGSNHQWGGGGGGSCDSEIPLQLSYTPSLTLYMKTSK